MDKPDVTWYKSRVIEIRNVIRGHRDAIGDERCWADDYLVWRYLKDFVRPPWPRTMDEMLAKCRPFYHLRGRYQADPILPGAIRDPKRWDKDLEGLCRYQLADKIDELIFTIRLHNDVVEHRDLTYNDDRDLYLVLPEKLPADFRLTPEEEFLGRAKPNAGCQHFFESHIPACVNCSFHQWGPCR